MTRSRLTENSSSAENWMIDGLEGDHHLVTRLRELGIHPGQQLQIVRRLPFGGPWVLRMGQVDLALRSEEAQCIWIRK